mmetsp:Transcript_21516/g.41752  ORF Transcript_21516/g.41752 Transcript_21516/m.41752 type:complete len:225 (+) Transcript_21516:98-772(+)
MSDKAKDDSTPDGVLLIDVRGEAEAQRDGVIPGSLSSQCDRNSDVQECVNKGLAKGVVPQDPKTAPPLIVYCRTGKRASRFAEELKRRGYKNITVGGMNDLKPIIEKQVGKTEENKSNTEANKETKQKKDKEEPGPRFSEDTVFIDVRGYEEAERDGTLPNSLTAQCDNSHDVKECVDKGLTKGAVPQDPKTAPPLVVYCRSGKRAQRFADELKRRGYKNITVG